MRQTNRVDARGFSFGGQVGQAPADLSTDPERGVRRHPATAVPHLQRQFHAGLLRHTMYPAYQSGQFLHRSS